MNTEVNEEKMRTDEESAESNATEKQEPSAKNTESPFRRAKRSAPTIAISCFIIFIVLYAIVNITALANIFSLILSVLTPIILGGAIAYLLNPILKLFEYKIFKKIKNRNLLRTLSLVMTYVTMILILVGIAFLLIPQLAQSIMEFASKFDSYIAKTTDLINSFASKFLGDNKTGNVIDESALLETITRFVSDSGSLFESIAGYVMEYGMGLVIGIKNFVLALFISIYVLSSKERLKAQSHKFTSAIFSEKGCNRLYRYMIVCHHTFGGFFIGKIIDSLIIGVITLVTLLIFRMPYALLVSTIVCITNVIPVFGPFIGAIPSFFIIFIASPSKAFLFLILILLIQQLDGNVIGPKILGDSTGLSSLGVIISIIIMGEYFGVIGMIVGVPIFAVIVALVKEYLENKLAAKKLPTDTAEYYEKNSLVDPYEKHEGMLVRIIKNISPAFHGFVTRLHKQHKDKKTIEKENNNKEKEENNKQ